MSSHNVLRKCQRNHLNFQAKVLQYKEQCQVMENRLFEVNHLANQSQIRLNDTNEVLKSLEERLRATEVGYFFFLNSNSLPKMRAYDVITDHFYYYLE